MKEKTLETLKDLRISGTDKKIVREEAMKKAIKRLKEEFCLLDRKEDCKCIACSPINKIFGEKLTK